MQVYSAAQAAAGISGTLSKRSAKENEPGVCSTALGGKQQQCTASQPDEVPVLVSGAGHDSLAMAELTQVCVTSHCSPKTIRVSCNMLQECPA